VTDDAPSTFPFEIPEQDAAPRRRRRWVVWVVAIVIVAVLAVAAWFAGDGIARAMVTSVIQQQVKSQLALPADQQVDVQLSGQVIPQLIGGRLDDVRVSSSQVSAGGVTGAADVTLHGLDLWNDHAMTGGEGTIRLDEQQLRTLLAAQQGFPAESVGLAAPNVTASSQLSFLGAQIPVSIALTPSAKDGALVLTPASLQIAGATATADDVRARFGALAAPLTQSWTICVAGSIPRGITLTGVSVEASDLAATFSIDGRILTDASLRQKGSCG
jgi:LmeA-like phospholipid-binding